MYINEKDKGIVCNMKEEIHHFDLRSANALYKTILYLIEFSNSMFNGELIDIIHIYSSELSNMSESRKKEYILGRYAATRAVEILENHSGIYIKRGLFNNPYLVGSDFSDISIAHSNEYVTAIAFDRNIILGVDCQMINSEDDVSCIWELLTVNEKRLLSSCTLEYNIMIMVFWTIKESVTKAIRTGLTIPMNILEIVEVVYSGNKIIAYMKNIPQYKTVTYIKDKLIISIALPKVLDIYGLDLSTREFREKNFGL